MELKQRIIFTFFAGWSLLIVPYGIETWKFSTGNTTLKLLIVPYGIETQTVLAQRVAGHLLIVPYGIETDYFRFFRNLE